MKNFSKWIHNSNKSYDTIIAQLDSYENWAPKEKDDVTGEVLKYEIVKLIESQELIVKGQKAKFTKYNFVYEKLKRHDKNESDRSKRVAPPVDVEVVILLLSEKVYYFINRAHNQNTLTILRYMHPPGLEYLSIANDEPLIDKDMFIWLIYKLMSSNTTLDSKKNFSLTNIEGIKGAPTESNDRFRVDGPGILSMTSSIAFLFEQRNIDRIRIKLNYSKHKDLVFSIDLLGNISFDFGEYIGPYREMIYKDTAIIILVFIEVIEHLCELYEGDIGKNEWSAKVRNEFFKGLFKKLNKKLNEILKTYN